MSATITFHLLSELNKFRDKKYICQYYNLKKLKK